MNQYENHQQKLYLGRGFVNKKSQDTSQPQQSKIGTPNNYYPIEQKIVQYAESRIVSENNSILFSNINTNQNKLSAFQVSSQMDSENNQSLPQQSMITQNVNQNSSQTYFKQRNNKLNVISNNQSSMTQKNSESSLNKRSGSQSRGGLRVLSRNSSMEKKSQTSVEKSIGQGGRDKDKKDSSMRMLQCGLNCNTRSPFIQAEQSNQVMIVPNLGSMETLKSQIVNRQLLSDRITNRSQNQGLIKNKFKTNSSQLTNIDQNQSIKQSFIQYPQYSGNLEKIYKQVRQMMEKQMAVSRKMYEKKFMDEMESLNLFYKSQIETLQKVLAENQTLIEQQVKKIEKLEDKCHKQHQKIVGYNDRLQSINKYIESTQKFSMQRLSQVQVKYNFLLDELHSLNLTPNQSSQFNNKLQHVQTVFTSLIAHTITKYRSIQQEMKDQVKDMMKKYDYFEQKIYEMDLMKHLGKENQIQNYRLIQQMQTFKEQLNILQTKNNFSSDVSLYKSRIQNGEVKNIIQLNELQNLLSRMQSQTQYWQKTLTQNYTKINKLSVDKQRLSNKINQLNFLVNQNQQEIQNFRIKNEQLIKDKQNNEQQLHSGKKVFVESELRLNSCEERYQFSSDKKSIQYPQEKIQNDKLSKQVQRLHEIMDQYECKIQQLHSTIQQLQAEKSNLAVEFNQRIQLLQRQKHQLQSTMNQKIQKSITNQSADQSSTILKLNILLQQNQNKLEQALHNLQQVTNEKQELNQALQMTQKIFDQQIQKFKATIQKLQQENQQLLSQLNDLRNSQHLSNSSSSYRNYQKVKLVLSKSPKKETCETVTMNWFKKNTQQKQSQSETQKLLNQSSSPQNQSNQTQSQRYHFLQNSPGQNDEFYYPSQTYQKKSSLMESNQNSYEQKSLKRKIEGQGNKTKHSSSYPGSHDMQKISSKVLKLREILQGGEYDIPVECILDNEGRLQLYNTGKYIVDKSYTTFQLTNKQLGLAQNMGLIKMVQENINQEQEEHYIF